MTPYLVRVIYDRMIVGFFCVKDRRDLHYWVVSVTDLAEREYRTLKSGGVVWEGASPIIPPDQGDTNEKRDDDAVSRAMASASLAKSWGVEFCNRDAKWKPMGAMQHRVAAQRASEA